MSGQFNHNIQDVGGISGLLKRHGINPTVQRLEIARILFARPQHLSAEQVLNTIDPAKASVSKATVYNTLNLFAEKGLVRQVIVDPNRIFYDSNTDTHYHFYNQDTGELMDLDVNEFVIDGMPEIPENTYQCGVDVIVHIKNKPLTTSD